MASTSSRQKPYTKTLPGGGTAAIMVPLILGGALILAVYILWDSHVRIERQAEIIRLEEEIRIDLVAAYREMCAGNPARTLEIVKSIDAKATIFNNSVRNDFSELKAARLMMEAMAEYMILCAEGAPLVEEKFTQAIGILMRASGEMWEAGMMGRARARLAQGKYREAVADFDVLLAGNPNYGSGYYWRAMARRQLDENEEAAADEERARNLGSWPPQRNYMQDNCPVVLESAL